MSRSAKAGFMFGKWWRANLMPLGCTVCYCAMTFENENETVVTVGRLLGVVSARNILWGVIWGKIKK